MAELSTKEKLLSLLENNNGEYFSGEELAEKLNVSRSAIWKAVSSLRNEGYTINAVTNKGYSLAKENDILSFQGISKYLEDEYKSFNINVLQTVDSTNGLLKEKANLGANEGTIIIANEQTKGRGRYGKSFHSPNGTGIYFSMLLRPKNYSPNEAARFTTMAAVALCEAIENVSAEFNLDISPKIKWVNDIFVNDRKVCGILTEADFDLENGMLKYAVLGIGINVYPPLDGFPDEIKDIAGAIFPHSENDLKNKLVANFINCFMQHYHKENSKEYIEKYRHYNMVVGKNIRVLVAGESRNAKALAINDQCELKVEYENGEIANLTYGEISIRL